MKLMIFFPIFPLVASLICFSYFLVGFAYLMAMDTLSPADLAANVAAAVEITPTCTSTNATQLSCSYNASSTGCDSTGLLAGSQNQTCTLSSPADELGVDLGGDILFYLMWYHLFGWLWINQLVSAISMTSIAGAYSWWYSACRDEEKQAQNKWAFMRSFKRVMRYYIGSMAFGAMIVALVQLARAIMAYIDKQTKPWQEKSKVLKLAFKVIHCCLYCFEKLVKFITRNAYIFIAINGKGFCKSAKHAFMTILKNLFLVAFVNLVSVVLIGLGKLFITLGAGVLCYLWLNGSDAYTFDETEMDDDTALLSGVAVPVLVTMALAYLVSSLFFYTYQLGVDTLLMCFIEEKNLMDKAADSGREVEFVGPESLVKFMQGKQADVQKDANAEGADGADTEVKP